MVRIVYLTNVNRAQANEVRNTFVGWARVCAGPPLATDRHSVAELKDMDMIGLWGYLRPDETTPDDAHVLTFDSWDEATIYLNSA